MHRLLTEGPSFSAKGLGYSHLIIRAALTSNQQVKSLFFKNLPRKSLHLISKIHSSINHFFLALYTSPVLLLMQREKGRQITTFFGMKEPSSYKILQAVKFSLSISSNSLGSGQFSIGSEQFSIQTNLVPPQGLLQPQAGYYEEIQRDKIPVLPKLII